VDGQDCELTSLAVSIASPREQENRPVSVIALSRVAMLVLPPGGVVLSLLVAADAVAEKCARYARLRECWWC